MSPSPSLVEATFGALLVRQVHSKGRSWFSKSKDWRLLACCPKPISNMAQETTHQKEQCSGPSKETASAAPLIAQPSCTPSSSRPRSQGTSSLVSTLFSCCFFSLFMISCRSVHFHPCTGLECLLHVVKTTICHFSLPLLCTF